MNELPPFEPLSKGERYLAFFGGPACGLCSLHRRLRTLVRKQ